MNCNQLIQTTLRLLLVLSLGTLTACDAQENANPVEPDKQGMGAIVGINYTGEGIQYFSVDEAGGGAVGRYGISGVVCCAMYPKQWDPELKVTVKWERTDGREPDGKRWKLKTVEKIIHMEKYTEDGRIYVAFLPHDEVRLYISKVGPRNGSFPSKLGVPQDPDENRRTPAPVENSKPYDPYLNRGNR